MAAWTCSSCGGENPEGMRFCGHCGAAAEAAASSAPDVSETLRSFVAQPVAERLVEAGGELPEERRFITALFADVSGFTSLADRLDPEELLEVIDPVISGLSSVVGRYEGYVEKFAGDALLALFGAPVSHEDDPERALLTALEMHRELAALCRELPHEAELTLHCGVNSGHGIARILGSEARMDYAVLGDSVILAQRLESAAPKGETYVSDLTYRMTADRFEFEPVGELTLKGKSEPVLAWRLLGEKRTAAVGATRPLVGRARELEAVVAVFERALEGWGGVLVVTGEPGVGKSRLTEAAREQAERTGMTWLQTRCLSYGAGLAYWPYAELIRSVASIHPDTEPEHARRALAAAVPVEGAIPYFARLLGLPESSDDDVSSLEPEAFRRGLHEAFGSWSSSLVAEKPIVLALEDAHWADTSSVDLTRELAQLSEKRALVIYLTSRPEGEAALGELLSAPRVIRLEPLDEDGIARLVEQVLGGPAPAGLVPWVVERTTGNPFFVEELVRALRDRAILERDNGAWLLGSGWETGDVPPTVEGLLASRIDLLPRSAAEVLQTASVIGRIVPVALLTEVRGQASTPELDVLVDRGMLDRVSHERGPTLSFHHALVQDVAYARLLRRQQRRLHRRVAEVAEQLYGAGDDVVDLLARHLYLGEAGAKAIDFLVRAGERARRMYANQEAIVHFGRAAELADSASSEAKRRVEILLALADLHDLVGDYDDAVRLYASLRAATSDLLAWRGEVVAHRKRGEYEAALSLLDEAFTTPTLVGEDLTPLWLERGWTLSTAGRFDEAIEALEAGVAAAGDRTDAVATQLLIPLARTEVYAGRLEDALRHATQAQTQFEQHGDLRLLSSAYRLVGDVYMGLGRTADAITTLERGLELAERVGNIEEIGGCCINLGLAYLSEGAFTEAIAANERAIAEFERIGHGSGRALGYSNLAWVFAKKGDYEEAERYCERAIELSRSIGHLLVAAETTDTLAFIRLQRGSADDAGVLAEQAADLFLELGAAPKAAQSLDLAAKAWDEVGDETRNTCASPRRRLTTGRSSLRQSQAPSALSSLESRSRPAHDREPCHPCSPSSHRHRSSRRHRSLLQ
jgi:adenylate cyclase